MQFRFSLPLLQRSNPCQNNSALFGRLYISNMQQRDGDPDVFLSHENQSYPPSISDYEKLRTNSKSDLIKELENGVGQNPADNFECAVIDGVALIHILSPGCTQTFADYCVNVFIPFCYASYRSFSE